MNAIPDPVVAAWRERRFAVVFRSGGRRELRSVMVALTAAEREQVLALAQTYHPLDYGGRRLGSGHAGTQYGDMLGAAVATLHPERVAASRTNYETVTAFRRAFRPGRDPLATRRPWYWSAARREVAHIIARGGATVAAAAHILGELSGAATAKLSYPEKAAFVAGVAGV